MATIAIRGKKDVDLAVKAAQKAYDESWGLNVPGLQRGKLLTKLADLVEDHAAELAALEALDNGMFHKLLTIRFYIITTTSCSPSPVDLSD